MIENSGVASSGTAESFLHVSNINKTRKALQITICALHKLLRKDLETELILEDINTDFDAWCETKCQEQPTFKFWFMVMRLVNIYLILILSFRGGSFEAYKASLSAMILLMTTHTTQDGNRPSS